ncbi:MAG: phenylalanine--tRNA ligase subunit beta [Planctomycetaceae bacterium]
MKVGWNWLAEYLDLRDVGVAEAAERLTMAGLNLEEVLETPGGPVIDLEVTSNRPDCLGHVGIARELGVLFRRESKLPAAAPTVGDEKTAAVTSVEIECTDLCPRYVARVIRGVRVGPSPDWLRSRLEAIGVASINNVVDATNYVLMECGQPLHAFDFDKLAERRIVVRRARPGEKIVAIDQREYPLPAEACVIADAERPVAIGGVMGGLDTEIGERTANVLLEAAQFAPLSVRNTARKLNLHSPSSYRFERGIDAAQLDWASRRCCELILELAGGELLSEPAFAGEAVAEQGGEITLRFAQLARILGIDVPAETAIEILERLGLRRTGSSSSESAAFVAPTWRRDLSREADLIEEVARIHGYDRIPDDVPVPLQLGAKTHRDRVTDRVRETLAALGFFEAVTLSFVSAKQAGRFTPPGVRAAVAVEHSSRREENVLRPSLVPSLLEARRANERHGTADARLFEIAKTYLAADPRRSEREVEPGRIAFVSGQEFRELKGVAETLARRANPAAIVTTRPADMPQFAPGRGAEVLLDGEHWGWLGELDRAVTDELDLKDAVSAAELDLATLEERADLAPPYRPLPQFPAITRDLNLLLDEATTWREVEEIVRDSAGELLESSAFAGQYRGKQIPADKKSYVLALTFRSANRTLTADEVDRAQAAVVEACAARLAAALR